LINVVTIIEYIDIHNNLYVDIGVT